MKNEMGDHVTLL